MQREETRVGDLLTRDVDAERVAAGWEGVRARRARPKIVRRAVTVVPVVAIAAVLLLLVRMWLAPGSASTSTAAATATATANVALAPIALAGGSALPSEWTASTQSPQSVPLDDGSRLELAPDAHVRTKPGAPDRVELAVDRGRTTFDIKPGGPRAWVVDAGPVVVRVLGTRFSVIRNGDDVVVTVERGKVSVESGGTVRVLTAGQTFETAEAAAKLSAPVEPSPATTTTTTAAPAPAAPKSAVSSVPAADPMDRADAQRRAGKPRDAVATLRGVVDSGDRRASLAAFTLAKIHAEDLGDSLSAAKWFDRAIALGLPAGLDEEAHARAVEHYARAGARAEASRARARYEARFPGGRHSSRVKAWAGGDD